jgi:hypothetical protein
LHVAAKRIRVEIQGRTGTSVISKGKPRLEGQIQNPPEKPITRSEAVARGRFVIPSPLRWLPVDHSATPLTHQLLECSFTV